MWDRLLACAACSVALLGGSPTLAQAPAAKVDFPSTPTVGVVHDYHGTKVADPYNWLEDLSSAEVRGWAAAQTAIAEKQVRRDPLRDRILSRMKVFATAYDDAQPRTNSVEAAQPVALARSADGTRNTLVLPSSREGATDGRVLVDPRTFGPDWDLTGILVSPDKRYVAYALSEKGSEWVETRIYDIESRKSLDDVVLGLLFEPPEWTHDSRGFFYVHNVRPAHTDHRHVTLQSPSIRYHRLGTPQAADHIAYSTPADSTDLVLQVELTDSGRHAIIYEGTEAHQSDVGWVSTRLLLMDLQGGLDAALRKDPIPLTAARDAAYRLVETSGTTLRVITDRGAPRRRLVEIDLANPRPEAWREIIPQRHGVLRRITRVGDKIAALYLDDVQHELAVFDAGGRHLRDVKLPPFSQVSDISAGETPATVRLSTTSFLQPPTVLEIDLGTGRTTVVHAAKGAFPHGDYETRQEWYRSKDGTQVPMFIVQRRGLRLDGTHPVWILGYGASGDMMLPDYSEPLLAWLELGGLFAMPALRGGGELGRDWYQAATRERKQTSFDDFAAAAEYLIARGYTTPSKLAIQGRSNGGLLVAATLTQRPELFSVAVAEVPLTDSLRGDRGRHRRQFGTAAEPADFPFLYAYSPLHRVKPGTCYPATYITTALNDDRAPAWHAFKFAAALQAAQSCGKPILLRADEGGGHMGGSTPDSWLEGAADVLAFMARHTGLGR